MKDSDEDHDDYWERLRFAYHQIANVCKTEREFVDAMFMINVLPGTPEYDEAKRAWQRFHPAKRGIP